VTTHESGRFALAFGTLGIVFGDIGTSPIYAFRESFEVSEIELTQATAYGVASVVFWSLMIVISAKYLFLVMRAHNHGEGGILALTALVMPPKGSPPSKQTAAIVTLGVFGTALLYGDGLITPAISVLSAVEGFEVATTAFSRFVIPVSILILITLFAVQHRGTAGIARVFSPVMVMWFGVLAILGARQIAKHPGVLAAVSPSFAIDLFISHPARAFFALGSIFLVVTGGEALYADMGHFGRIPITLSWYGLVLPSLLLIYFGQAALLGNGDGVIGNPFYDMAPRWGVAPLAVLATCATVIASQALISGAFSLTAQAVQLDYFPRVTIRHTSPGHVGQVYVPLVNWLLMVGCVALILIFRTSSALAAAYGIAVTTTMLITTLIFFRVVRDRWGWSLAKALIVLFPFMLVDIAFLSANVPKIPAGGWLPLLVGVVLVAQMTTWRRGRDLVNDRLRESNRTLAEVLTDVETNGIGRVPGTAVYLFRDHGNVPPALAATVRHHRVLHEQVVLVSVAVADEPYVGVRKRAHRINLAGGVVHVKITFGFMDDPDVPAVLAAVEFPHHEFDTNDVTYFLGRESVTAGNRPGMHPLRDELFVLLHRGAASAARFYHLPPAQVIEVGAQVEL
jgi:KUP system potassium uptake protein